MAQVKRYKAKKEFKLDCGHVVKPGDEFVVTKSFTCELHAATMPYKARQVESKEGEPEVAGK